MNTIKINGQTIHVPDGAQVVIGNNNLCVNGASVVSSLSGIVKVVIEGVVENLEVHGDVEAGNVGNLNVKGDVTCGNVSGNINAKGDVHCGNIGGSFKAGGDIYRK